MAEISVAPKLSGVSRQHYEILDGFRGVAAVAVVIFHFMEMTVLPVKNFIGHGFLAVDFFFCLSGFVIGYAYDNRLAKLGVLEFLKMRAIRLHPLVILGGVLGLLAFLYDPFSTYANNYSAGTVALMFLLQLILIPYPYVSERSGNLFPLNAPAWSLFWEYIANILYAFVLVRLPKAALWIVLILGVIAMCTIKLYYPQEADVSGGWSINNFWVGGARILYSFPAGLLIYRYGLVIKNNLGFLVLGIILFLSFLVPYNEKNNFITEHFIVFILFPLLIMLGAGAKLSSSLRPLCNFLGNLSYPLYMTHYAAIWIFTSYFQKYNPQYPKLGFVIGGGVLFLIITGYLAMVLYDIPVRRYLNKFRKQPGKVDLSEPVKGN